MPDERPRIFETAHWEVILMRKQRYLGRSVVVLKRRCSDLADLTAEEWSDFHEVVKKLEAGLRKAFQATMFNWTCMMNDAYKETPPNPEMHWHCRPRYDHPVQVAGQTFTDPNFGHHYLREPKDEYLASDELLSLIADKIKKNL